MKKTRKRVRKKQVIAVALAVVVIAIVSFSLNGYFSPLIEIKEKVSEPVEVLGPEKPKEELKGKDRILSGKEEYPDWLLEFWNTHPESTDWVSVYPDFQKRPQEEIDQDALQNIDLEKHKQVNGIPLLFQWDPKWGYASYGESVIGIEGCGPTCLSMVLTGLLDDPSYTPKRIADFSLENGYYHEGSGTDWTLMEFGAQELGLAATQIQTWSGDVVKGELQAGHPMICSMGPGDFTDKGHFIVLSGVTEDGSIIVNDPNSPKNSETLWDVWTLLNQMKGMWTFSIPE